MKSKKCFALLLAGILMLSLTLAQASAVDGSSFAGYDGWLNDDFTAKTVKYQLTGEWDLAEYGIFDQFLMNLYDDGSMMTDQRNTGSASSYLYFGYWSEENTEDGNEISLDVTHVTGLEGNLIPFEYHFDLYEEDDGNYSFSYKFGIAPAQYIRDVQLSGGAEIAYATTDDFHAAVDKVLEMYRFETEEPNEGGMTALISIKGNYTATAQLLVEFNGNTVSAYEETGTLNAVADESGDMTYTLVLNDVEIPLETYADGSFGDFTWHANWASQGIEFDMEMTAVDPVND